jgi:hypothetical protein
MRIVYFLLLLFVGCSGDHAPQGVHIGNALTYVNPHGYKVVVNESLAKTESLDKSVVSFDTSPLLRAGERLISRALISVKSKGLRTDKASLLQLALTEHPERSLTDFRDVQLKNAVGIAYDPQRSRFDDGQRSRGQESSLRWGLVSTDGQGQSDSFDDRFSDNQADDRPSESLFYVVTQHGSLISIDVRAYSQAFGFTLVAPIPYSFDGGVPPAQ